MRRCSAPTASSARELQAGRGLPGRRGDARRPASRSARRTATTRRPHRDRLLQRPGERRSARATSSDTRTWLGELPTIPPTLERARRSTWAGRARGAEPLGARQPLHRGARCRSANHELAAQNENPNGNALYASLVTTGRPDVEHAGAQELPQLLFPLAGNTTAAPAVYVVTYIIRCRRPRRTRCIGDTMFGFYNACVNAVLANASTIASRRRCSATRRSATSSRGASR